MSPVFPQGPLAPVCVALAGLLATACEAAERHAPWTVPSVASPPSDGR